MPTDRVEAGAKVPEFYSLRCHYRCPGVDDGRRFSTLADANAAGLEHYERTGHVAVIHAIIPIKVRSIPGIDLPGNGLRSEPW